MSTDNTLASAILRLPRFIDGLHIGKNGQHFGHRIRREFQCRQAAQCVRADAHSFLQ
jgi:hypothetical protein